MTVNSLQLNDFGAERWAAIRATYAQWWAGALDRPIMQFTPSGQPPGRPPPRLKDYGFQAFYDLSVPAEDIVDGWDYDLRGMRFLGDAFPTVRPSFGACVLVLFLGARPDIGATGQNVWFHPVGETNIRDLHFAFDPNNRWFNRVLDLYRAATKRWEGRVLIGMPDMGPPSDALGIFRTAETFMTDLYDFPDEIQRLTWELHDAWWQYYRAFEAVLRPVNPGYTDFLPLFSDVPFATLQSDVSYMIGPQQFREFILPELAAATEKLGNTFYHLCGVGNLPHLDAVLSLERLKAVQWAPGHGHAQCTGWPDVFRKIRQSGRGIHVYDCYADEGTLDAMAGQLGSAKGIFYTGVASTAEKAQACLEKHGYEA